MKTTVKLFVAALLLTLPAVVQAQFGDFTYTREADQGTTITGYIGVGGAVVIPDMIEGDPLVRIGDYVFNEQTSVTIPRFVATIGDYAFTYCTSLSAINVDVLNFFYSSVDGVLFNKSQTLLLQSPRGKVGGYTIPNSVTSLGVQAFYLCTGLSNVTIPHSVTNIGDSAFGSCNGLTSVTIPSSTTSVGDQAFAFCESLTNVTIPSSVTSIGDAAFSGCYSLSAITVEALNSHYSSLNGVLFNQSQTLLIQYPEGKVGSYTIPSSVTNIGNGAFSRCYGLTRVTIPTSVTVIGDGAFHTCPYLTEIYFQGNAPSVGTSVFVRANNAVVYYLLGTTEWYGEFNGAPTRLWNPLVQTSDASFGVRTNRFGFNIIGTADIPLVVEASTTLAGPSWVALQSLNLTNGPFYFSDPEWTNFPARTYRIRSP